MLSAIAARKAAQTSHAGATKTPIQATEEESRGSSSEQEEVVSLGKKSAKRRPSKIRSTSSGAKKKKPRYFAEKQKLREDVGSEASTSDVEGEELGFDAPVRRAWSPSVPLRDSSDEESTNKGRNQIKSPTLRPLTAFTPTLNQNIFYLSQDKLSALDPKSMQGTLIVLSAEETLCIGGVYLLTVLRGTVSLLGTTLRASTRRHRIYAPKSSPLPVLEAISSEPSILSDDLSQQLGILGLSGTVILIQELQTGVQRLGHVCKVFSGVFDYTNQGEYVKMLNVMGAYMLRNQGKDHEPYVLPESWATALNNMSPPSTGGVYFIKGPKKTGKSTFARTLLNHLLVQFERVAYLECDPGQSEFTPGGMVALNIIEDHCFGPPFTHPTLPNRAHYVGATTPRSSPAHYLASVQALFQAYELDIRSPLLPYDDRMDVQEDVRVLPSRISDVIPLVVNTMGWNKGLGADLTRRIQDIVQPTHVFEITGSNSLEDFSYEANSQLGFESKSQLYAQLDSIVPSATAPLQMLYTPADHRVINLLSYLHAVFPAPSHELELAELSSATSLEQITATSWRTALPLCSQPPYAVDWQIALDRIVLVGSGAEDVIPTELGRVLNGALVGLVSSWEDSANANGDAAITESGNQDSESLSARMPYVQGARPPAPTSSTCFGIALIRSVSHFSPLAGPEAGAGSGTSETESSGAEIHVLTPVPPPFLKHSRVFVKGDMELPIWGMLDCTAGDDEDEWKNGVAGVEWGRVPYLQWGKGEGAGAQRRRVRRNLMRKAQM